jgi:hypothetical protein
LPEDDGYRPQNYQEALLCASCGKEFRKWESMERAHKGHITFKLCKCGSVLDAHFDLKRKFYDVKWTRERVIEEIKIAEKEGRIHQCYKENRPLQKAAQRRFGSWKNAIRVAKRASNGNILPKSTPIFCL